MQAGSSGNFLKRNKNELSSLANQAHNSSALLGSCVMFTDFVLGSFRG